MYVISAARGLNQPKTLQHWSWLHHCRWKAGVFDLLLQLNRLRSTIGQNRPNHLSLSIESNAKGCLNAWACMPVRSECAGRPCQITCTVLRMALNYVFSAWSVKSLTHIVYGPMTTLIRPCFYHRGSHFCLYCASLHSHRIYPAVPHVLIQYKWINTIIVWGCWTL